MKTLQVPKLKDQPSWPRTKVSFIVGPDGRIYDEQVFLQEPILEYRRAMLVAVRTLPRFKPGYQAGKPVAVKFTIPFSCLMLQ
ncbi:MAG: energy transducer TonB [Janthinobacterium lividum]